MNHKPGHLQFDDSAPTLAKARTPKAIDFGDAGAGAPDRLRQRALREPGRAFHDSNISVTPAIEHARATFPEFAKSQEHSLEIKLRQLVPWQHEVVAAWGGKALDENAAATSRAAQLINRFAVCGIAELVENATATAQRGASSLLHRLFLRRKVISCKPELAAAKSRLAQLLKEGSNSVAALGPLTLQLRLNLVALAAAYDTLAKPAEDTLDAAIASRRALLQQAIHQAELTVLQLTELKQQMTEQLHNVDQLLTITIPAFEIADAAR